MTSADAERTVAVGAHPLRVGIVPSPTLLKSAVRRWFMTGITRSGFGGRTLMGTPQPSDREPSPAVADTPPSVDANDAPVVPLDRAVGLNEAADIARFGGVRPGPRRCMEDKWFATTHDDAVRWGRGLQRLDRSRARPFRIAELVAPRSFVDSLQFVPWHDAIGPACVIPMDRRPTLNAVSEISVHDAIDDPGGWP